MSCSSLLDIINKELGNKRLGEVYVTDKGWKASFKITGTYWKSDVKG